METSIRFLLPRKRNSWGPGLSGFPYRVFLLWRIAKMRYRGIELDTMTFGYLPRRRSESIRSNAFLMLLLIGPTCLFGLFPTILNKWWSRELGQFPASECSIEMNSRNTFEKSGNSAIACFLVPLRQSEHEQKSGVPIGKTFFCYCDVFFAYLSHNIESWSILPSWKRWLPKKLKVGLAPWESSLGAQPLTQKNSRNEGTLSSKRGPTKLSS